MPTSTIVQEVNATAGSVGTSYRLIISNSEPLRINAGPGRTATLTNNGPGTLRAATIDNAGAYGTFADIATGATSAVTTADKVYVLQGVDNPTGVFVAIT